MMLGISMWVRSGGIQRYRITPPDRWSTAGGRAVSALLIAAVLTLATGCQSDQTAAPPDLTPAGTSASEQATVTPVPAPSPAGTTGSPSSAAQPRGLGAPTAAATASAPPSAVASSRTWQPTYTPPGNSDYGRNYNPGYGRDYNPDYSPNFGRDFGPDYNRSYNPDYNRGR